MAVTASLLEQLRNDFPDLTFAAGEDFRWSPEERTIYYDPTAADGDRSLLHETAHADLNHRDFTRDINLLKLEREAWSHARSVLAPRYDTEIESDVTEAALDSYRDWLHARSLCPQCGQTGLQQADRTYRCLLCDHRWRANDARRCALRRYAR